MCEVERQYNKDMWIRINVKYDKNYRKYYLSFSYFKKEPTVDDVVWEHIQPLDDRNFKILLDEANRYSSKRFNKFCEMLDKNQVEILDIYEDLINGKECYIDNIIETLMK